ncbi:MAG TPA: biotin/lipoyl-binding protein, partial [Candidatus Methylomirabilis sp.]
MKKMLALAITTLTLISCGKSDRAVLPAGTSTDTAVGVKVVRPGADAGTVLRATGELRARNDATLSAEATGRILHFTVDVGARVKKGELLMELDASGARIQLAQAHAARTTAEAAHKMAVSDLRRTEELARGDAATPAILERAQIGEEQAAAVLQQATAAAAAAKDQLV